MGIFERPDSKVWWLYLETTHTKERTAIRVGTTSTQRRDSLRLAEDLYHQRMNELGAKVHKLSTARPAIRFDAYAEIYARDVIVHHRGKEREAGLLTSLRRFFGDDLLQMIDRERVQQWMAVRARAVKPRTVNRELGMLKAMLKNAVPTYVEASPLVGLPLLKAPPIKRRLMAHDEEARILAASTCPIERALLILAVDSLVRMGDLIDLTRHDRRDRWIYLHDPKHGESTEVALSQRGAEALDAIPDTGPYYFQKYRAVLDRDRHSRVRRVLTKLCRKADVPYGRNHDGITFHWATRRTGATRMLVERGKPLTAVQRQGTWKDPNVLLKIYAEADRAALLDAVDPFPSRSRARRKRA